MEFVKTDNDISESIEGINNNDKEGEVSKEEESEIINDVIKNNDKALEDDNINNYKTTSNQPEIFRRMAIYSHNACYLHNIPDHPEQPSRVNFILNAIKKKWPTELSYRDSPSVTDEQIMLFHSKSLLQKFNYLSTKAIADTKKLQIIDSDTMIMNKTKEAAYRAAGSIISAIDHLYLPENHKLKIETAFCVIRPPGHHAEPNKSCGFCFFNNVAIGAKYAQNKYNIKKVAVLDFDVHHGNGTEEGFKLDKNLFYGSTHEKDNFPGTGKDPTPFIGPLSREEFRIKWTEILSEMELFKPDLVLISAGFDAHDEDPLASCELTEEDFEWITKQILVSCYNINNNSSVPCLSILEGGYDLDAICSSSIAHVNILLQGYKPEYNEDSLPYCGGDEVKSLVNYMKSVGI